MQMCWLYGWSKPKFGSISRFYFVVNLKVPAKPNYSLVLYYASERPINKDSLLAKFMDGSDMFRDSRFKLIPSIVEVCDSWWKVYSLFDAL
jgi:hypothetical protein